MNRRPKRRRLNGERGFESCAYRNQAFVAPVSEETHISSAWVSALDTKSPEPVAARPLDGKDIWVVDELLTEGECKGLLALAESQGFGTTNYDWSYRGNLRLTTIDQSLAEAIWRRLKPLVPAKIWLEKPACHAEAVDSWWHHYPSAEGMWKAVGLNECWRLAKYRPQDRFMCHCDEAYVRNESEMSMLTVNIYMNSVEGAGNTRFFFEEHWQQQFEEGHNGSNSLFHLRPDATPDFELKPKAGTCLLFQQPPGRAYYHDGDALESGLKYLFRSDVMYRKVKASQHT